jgi:hypothetical protein
MHVVHDAVADHERALGRLLEPGDHAQRRGLAAARGPDEHHELLVVDLEVELLDDAHVAEALRDPLECYAGHA